MKPTDTFEGIPVFEITTKGQAILVALLVIGVFVAIKLFDRGVMK